MSNPSSAAALISLAVLAFILYRQLQVRVVPTRLTLPAILTIAGLAGLAGASQGAPLATQDLVTLAILLSVDAVGLGAVRAYTVRLWHEGGAWHRQGTWLTAGLWLVGMGFHVAVDGAVGFDAASALLYLGVTYGAQRLVVQRRVAKLAGITSGRIALDGRTQHQ